MRNYLSNSFLPFLTKYDLDIFERMLRYRILYFEKSKPWSIIINVTIEVKMKVWLIGLMDRRLISRRKIKTFLYHFLCESECIFIEFHNTSNIYNWLILISTLMNNNINPEIFRIQQGIKMFRIDFCQLFTTYFLFGLNSKK